LNRVQSVRHNKTSNNVHLFDPRAIEYLFVVAENEEQYLRSTR
jgi:hypothetical protein